MSCRRVESATLYAILAASLFVWGCSGAQRVTADGERRPLAVGVLTDRTASACHHVMVSGQRLRVCPAENREAGADTLPEVAGTPLIEFRLAYAEPAPDRVQVDHAGDPLFLAPEPTISDADFLRVRPWASPDWPEGVLFSARCTPEADRRKREATAGHVGGLIAILWQSRVRHVTVVRGEAGCAPRLLFGLMARDGSEVERIMEAVVERWPDEDPGEQ